MYLLKNESLHMLITWPHSAMFLSSNKFVLLICILFNSGVHRYLHSWDVRKADSHGSVLLLPGGLEYLWWLHRELEFSGAGAGWCRRAVRTQILQIGAYKEIFIYLWLCIQYFNIESIFSILPIFLLYSWECLSWLNHGPRWTCW